MSELAGDKKEEGGGDGNAKSPEEEAEVTFNLINQLNHKYYKFL